MCFHLTVTGKQLTVGYNQPTADMANTWKFAFFLEFSDIYSI